MGRQSYGSPMERLGMKNKNDLGVVGEVRHRAVTWSRTLNCTSLRIRVRTLHGKGSNPLVHKGLGPRTKPLSLVFEGVDP